MLRFAEEKDFLKKTKDLKERQKQETVIANAGLVWSNEILPSWNTAYVFVACITAIFAVANVLDCK